VTTRPDGDTLAPPGSDPLGSAARLRRARLDPDVLPARVRQVVVDLGVLLLLLAVPGLATALALALEPAAEEVVPIVGLVALAVAGLTVVAGVAVVWPHHDGGRTAGMRWAGLRVVDRAGGAPSRTRLLVRALALPLDVLVGPALVLSRADRRRLGDLLAGTQVVRDLSMAGGGVGRPIRRTAPPLVDGTGPPPTS